MLMEWEINSNKMYSILDIQMKSNTGFGRNVLFTILIYLPIQEEKNV